MASVQPLIARSHSEAGCRRGRFGCDVRSVLQSLTRVLTVVCLNPVHSRAYSLPEHFSRPRVLCAALFERNLPPPQQA